MKKFLSLALIFGVLLLLNGCGGIDIWYELPPEFVTSGDYSAEARKSLGFSESPMVSIYDLKGFSEDEYLYMKKSSSLYGSYNQE